MPVVAFQHINTRSADAERTRGCTRALLRAAGLEFREAVVPRDTTVQIFVRDPDGVTVELNFAQ